MVYVQEAPLMGHKWHSQLLQNFEWILVLGVDYLFIGCWPGGSCGTQITKDSGTVVAYMPELFDKAPFLKTPYVLVTGHRERKLRLTWKFPPHWLAFIVLRGSWGRSVCSFMDPVCYNTSICLLAQFGMTIMDTTTAFWLNLRLAWPEGIHVWCCKPKQNPVAAKSKPQ